MREISSATNLVRRASDVAASIHLYLSREQGEFEGWTTVRESDAAIECLARGAVVEASLACELADPVLEWMEAAVVERDFLPPPMRIHVNMGKVPLSAIERVARLRYAALRACFGANETRQLHEERILVCEALSDLFIEACNHEDDELDEIAPYLASSSFSLTELDRIAKRDFCGSMWFQGIGVLLSGGMSLPLFGWPAGEIRQRVERYIARRHAWKLLPFWWIGYGLARLCMRGVLHRLRVKVDRLRNAAD